MPEINLLANNTARPRVGMALATIMYRAFSVVLVLILAYFGFVIYATSSTNKVIAAKTAQINRDQEDILNNKDREQLITRQSQLKHVSTVLKNHVYWSRFFTDLGRATLQSASYGGFTSDQDGVVTATVLVPDYATLDRFLQVFDLPAYNGNFSDVRVSSISKVVRNNVPSLDVRIKFKYNVESLKGTASAVNQ